MEHLPEKLPEELLEAFKLLQQQLFELHLQWIEQLRLLYPDHAGLLSWYHKRFCEAQLHEMAIPLLFASSEQQLSRWLLNKVRVADEGRTQIEDRMSAARRYTRTMLVAAAARLILKGETLTMLAVAGEAGLGLSTVHAHFTKPELLRAAYVQLLEPIVGVATRH